MKEVHYDLAIDNLSRAIIALTKVHSLSCVADPSNSVEEFRARVDAAVKHFEDYFYGSSSH